jgi:hypothetical protein
MSLKDSSKGSRSFAPVRRGLSQEALAVDAGIDRSYVGRTERGVENPNLFDGHLVEARQPINSS